MLEARRMVLPRSYQPRGHAADPMGCNELDSHAALNAAAPRRVREPERFARTGHQSGLRGHVPRHEIALASALFPAARAIMARAMRVDRAGFERSRRKIDEVFASVSERLGDGRRYLVGDGFTAADFTFAALAAPVVLPPEYTSALPSLDELADEGRRAIEGWRETPAGQFARRVFREDRRRRA